MPVMVITAAEVLARSQTSDFPVSWIELIWRQRWRSRSALQSPRQQPHLSVRADRRGYGPPLTGKRLFVTASAVQSTTREAGKLVIVFDDRSTMTVKTAEIAAAISPGVKIKAVLESGHECALQFEDGSSITLQIIDPGASVAVRDRNNAIEYLG